MDAGTQIVLTALSTAHDRMQVHLAALTAVVGALTENQKPDMERVDAWCDAISTHSDPEHGVSAEEVRRFAHDLLVGVDAKKMN